MNLPLESISGATRAITGRNVLKTDLSDMRVLQFAPRAPWPLDTGAKLRNYHLGRVLATRARVSLLAFSERVADETDLTSVYEQVATVHRGGGYSFTKILRGAMGRTPLPLLNYTSREMKQALARVLAENEFDVVQVESFHLMNYLPVIRAARHETLVVCDWHNIESDLMRQYAGSVKNTPRKAYAQRTARLMSDFERRALDNFDAHIAVSEHDVQRLRQVNNKAQVLVIENGVDVDYYRAVKDRERTRVVFVGSMDYHANVEGVVDFARNVWPVVHQRNSGLRFTIVGRDPIPAVRELTSIAGIEVTGTVDDVRPYYAEAVAAIVPLNVGGGSRLKILEAMAAGVPVVSTSRGAEGLHVQHGENIVLVDANAKLAEALVTVIDDQELRKRIIKGGHVLAQERYDWSQLGAALFNYYQRLLSERSPAAARQEINQ